ncbi:stage V sporulation protein S-domain-containing protein [Haematococcus lacustris]
MESRGPEVVEIVTPKDSGTAATPEEVEGLASGKFIKVGAGSNVKSVAGKISHSARESEPPATLCIGATSINQAVKAICIARQYLKSDDLDLSFQPAFRGKERRANVALYIAKSAGPRAPLLPEGEVVDLQVSSRSRPVQVAGALAARVREGANVSLVAIGVDAVSNAVLTIGNTRLYLEQNNLDIRAAPEFITVQKEERALNAVRFIIKSETI